MGRTRKFVGGVILCAGLVATLADGSSSGSDSTDSDSSSGASASAELACEHFRNIMGDVSDGVLTDSELREKLKEVDSDAYVADEADIVAASRDMLAAATTGGVSDLTVAVTDMDSACENAGL